MRLAFAQVKRAGAMQNRPNMLISIKGHFVCALFMKLTLTFGGDTLGVVIPVLALGKVAHAPRF